MKEFWEAGNSLIDFLPRLKMKIKRQLPPREQTRRVRGIVEKACARGKITRAVLLSGSRKHGISAVRAELARVLVEKVGISMAECARQIRVASSGVAQALRRHKCK